MERKCMECGGIIREKGNSFICKDCRKKIYESLRSENVISEQIEDEDDKVNLECEDYEETHYCPIYPMHEPGQIEEDVKAAAKLGMSYGYYKASQRYPRRKW